MSSQFPIQHVRNFKKSLLCLMLGGIGGRRRRGRQGWDGWLASLTQWTWVWENSRSWCWKGRPGVLRFMGSQRVGHDWATELNWKWAQRPWRGGNEWKNDWRDMLILGKCYSTSHCTFQDWVQVSVPSSLTHKSKQFPRHKHNNVCLGICLMQQDRFLSLFDDPRRSW